MDNYLEPQRKRTVQTRFFKFIYYAIDTYVLIKNQALDDYILIIKLFEYN